MAKKRTYPVLANEVDRLRQSLGLSLERLARDAGIDIKTLRRILNGKQAYLDTIQAIATVLRTTPDSLRADASAVEPEHLTTYTLDLHLQGYVKDPLAALSIVSLTPKIIEMLREHGVEVTGHQAALGMQQYSGDAFHELKRTIALIYGVLANGGPFWAFVAVRTHKYKQFIIDQSQGKIDLTQFEFYGELIICGEGRYPDDEVIKKVAGMYQTEYEQFALNVQEDIKAAMPVLQAALESNNKAE